MVKSNEKHFIYYGSSGFSYHFYLVGTNLYVRVLKEAITYNTMKLEEKTVEFSVGIDTAGKFHIASILETGHLKYGIYFNEAWESRNLMTFDRYHSQLKNIILFVFEEKIHILMAQSYTENSDLWIIKHYYWNKQSWENQKICEIITEPYDVAFHADLDSKNNIHLVYKSRVGKYYQIYYAKFLLNYRSWNIPVKISEGLYEHTHPFVLCDNKDQLHVTWSSFIGGHYEIRYFNAKQPISYKNNTRKEILRISKNGTDCSQPYLIQLENEMIIFWREGIHLFSQAKEHDSDKWGETRWLANLSEKNLARIGVLGNSYRFRSPIKVLAALGYINDEILLLGVDSTVSQSKDKEDHGETEEKEEEVQPPDIFIDPFNIIDESEVLKPENDLYEETGIFEKLEEIIYQNQQIQKDLQSIIERHQSLQADTADQLISLLKAARDITPGKKGFIKRLQDFFIKNDP
ncbi:hypothetical protein SAMN02745975_00066 [Geosporobacter subterraneus DSM 17957]|uniref:Uncharacterized protein n=1 Tax=Geosporobacter subterraneus DSM 17957 TaxID=1121919 RepID=A0A1M6BUX8_9FIRM|nr:hypothetical protein [Geosporobacter subterraneus]SHI52501.1 hypothetical protein SAMN02745975_00066 [Geosporobacter subterraneus DSM 17957]